MSEVNEFGQQVGGLVTPSWAPRGRPEPVSLAGRYVTLEPVATAHAAALHAALCGPGDESLWTYRPTPLPPDPDALATLVEGWASSTESLTWTVVPVGGDPAGVTSFYRIDPDHGQVEVAAVLYARSLQRTPATTEATHLLMRYAFDDLGYRRFEWKCDSLNEPSRRAAIRLGFTYEGRFRHHMVTKGRNRDTDWFSVTDAEWPAVRRAQEEWLDPANLKPDGRQRRSLSELRARVDP